MHDSRLNVLVQHPYTLTLQIKVQQGHALLLTSSDMSFSCFVQFMFAMEHSRVMTGSLAQVKHWLLFAIPWSPCQLQYKARFKVSISIQCIIMPGIRGIKKRKLTRFKKGHKPAKSSLVHNVPLQAASTSTRRDAHRDNEVTLVKTAKCERLPKNEFNDAIKQLPGSPVLAMTDCDGEVLDGMILRPRPCAPELADIYAGGDGNLPGRQQMHTYRFLHMIKVEELWNIAIEGHRKNNFKCRGRLSWDHSAEIAQGLCWSERLMCDKCNYVSPKHKLFECVETGCRGRPSADLNVRLQVALAHSMISNTAFQRILATLCVPPPASTGMQHMANKVGEDMIRLNQQSMRCARARLRKMNVAKGMDENTKIRAGIDCKYNTWL